MQDKEVYHASAVQYNEGLALAAEEQANLVQDPVVKKWCRAIAKQHRFHLKRHRAALARLQGSKQPQSTDEESRPKTIAEEQAEFAAQKENLGDVEVPLEPTNSVIGSEEHDAPEGTD
jgi:hypothetical protein